jgi:hypothetical protein
LPWKIALGGIVDYGLEGFACSRSWAQDVINVERLIAMLATGDHGDAGDIKARTPHRRTPHGSRCGRSAHRWHQMQQLGLCACGCISMRDLAEMDGFIALVLHAQD